MFDVFGSLTSGGADYLGLPSGNNGRHTAHRKAESHLARSRDLIWLEGAFSDPSVSPRALGAEAGFGRLETNERLPRRLSRTESLLDLAAASSRPNFDLDVESH